MAVVVVVDVAVVVVTAVVVVSAAAVVVCFFIILGNELQADKDTTAAIVTADRQTERRIELFWTE